MIERYILAFTVEQLPMNFLNNKHSYWKRHAETKKWDALIHNVIRIFGKPEVPLKRAELTLVRHSSSRMDWDNLAATFKHPVDSLVSCGVLEDDSWDVIGMPDFSQVKAPPRKGFIEIVVRDLG